jgi:hypothetical protein
VWVVNISCAKRKGMIKQAPGSKVRSPRIEYIS